MDASFDRNAIRGVLKLWSDSRQLGQHPLARLAHVEAWRRRQGYSDSDSGRGVAFREQLQKSVDSLRPADLPPDRGAKSWRPYLIITEQFINGRGPEWVAAQLHVSKRTYYREQRRALERLGDVLRQRQIEAEPKGWSPFLAPPPVNRPFIGRDALLEQLIARLTGGSGRVALHGLPGVGKTSLLLELAHHPVLRERFADGVLWARLGRAPDLLFQLGRWAQALEIPDTVLNRAQTVPERAQLVHDRLGDRRVLLCLDDAWSLEAALALQLGGAGCAQLLTTRFPDLAFDFAGDGTLPVTELSDAHGMALLTTYRPDMDPQLVAAVVDRVGGLPLGLHLAGRYLRRSGAAAAASLLASPDERLGLSRPESPLVRHDELPAGTPQSLHNTIDLTVQILEPAGRRALAALAWLPPKPGTFSQSAARAVTGDALKSLYALVDAGLVEHVTADRFALHQTVHDYASLLPPNIAAAPRLVRWTVTYAERFTSDAAALDDELDLLLHGLDLALQQEQGQWLARGIVALHPLLVQRSRFTLADRYLRAAARQCPVETAPEVAVRVALAHALNERVRGVPGEARALATAAGDMARAYNLPLLEADAWHQLCVALIDLGATDEALEAGARAREKYAEMGADLAAAEVGLRLGTVQLRRGALDEAEDAFVALRRAARDSGDAALEASGIYSLALLYFQRADARQALRFAEDALAAYRSMGNEASEARTLELIGNYHGNEDRFEVAIGYHRRALALAQATGDMSTAAHIMSNLAHSLRILWRLDEAEEYARRARSVSRQTRRKRDEASATIRLMQILADGAQLEDARRTGLRALALAREMQEWWYEVETLTWLGWIALDAGDLDDAARRFTAVLDLQPEPKYVGKWLEAQSGLAWLALQEGRAGVARRHMELLWEHASSLDGLPLRAALCAHDVWSALGDARGEKMVDAAAVALRDVAAHIADRAERKRFLDENPIRRRVLALATAS